MQIQIKGKTYSGTVTIYDRLTLPQVELVEEALNSALPQREDGRVPLTPVDKARLPALFACVEKWELNIPVTVDTFPMTPRRETHDLIMQIFLEIAKIYNGELDIPNE